MYTLPRPFETEKKRRETHLLPRLPLPCSSSSAPSQPRRRRKTSSSFPSSSTSHTGQPVLLFRLPSSSSSSTRPPPPPPPPQSRRRSNPPTLQPANATPARPRSKTRRTARATSQQPKALKSTQHLSFSLIAQAVTVVYFTTSHLLASSSPQSGKPPAAAVPTAPLQMEDSSTSAPKPPPRKMKFAPKIPPKKEPKLVISKQEPDGAAADNLTDSKLLNLVKQAEHGPGRRMPKIEKKAAPMQVAFGKIDPRTAARSLCVPRSAEKHRDATTMTIKEYEDPWNYYSYYPVTLPLRLPRMGNPELLDEAEFGKSSSTYDESLINPAEELGLMEERTGEMLFFQFPASLPLGKQPPTVDKGKEIEAKRRPIREKGCKLEELPPGYMGKLLVYKSGAVKLKLGEALFNVSPGSDCIFAQDVMAINTQEKQCCVLGELRKRAVVAPDLDDILRSVPDL